MAPCLIGYIDEIGITEVLPILQGATDTGILGGVDVDNPGYIHDFVRSLEKSGNGQFLNQFGEIKYPIGVKLWPRLRKFRLFKWTPDSGYLLRRPFEGGYETDAHSEFDLHKILILLRRDVKYRGGWEDFLAEVSANKAVTFSGSEWYTRLQYGLPFPRKRQKESYEILSSLLLIWTRR